MNSTLIAIAALLIVLGVLVFVHEAGHFIAAKWAGIYVHRFSLGLGAPVKALTWKRGETEYVISWLPLGGYVKMASREEEVTSSALEGGRATTPVPPDRFFESKPIWKRMIVILAGVTMNILFAWVVFTILIATKGAEIVSTTRVGIVDTLGLPPSAQPFRALEPGDRITAINGVPVANWNDVIDRIREAPGPSLTFSIDGKGDITAPIPGDALEDRAALVGSLGHYQKAVVGNVESGSPAGHARIQLGDTIVAINGDSIAQWYDMVTRIQASGDKPLQLLVGTSHGRRDTVLTPRVVDLKVGKETRKVGQIGIGFKEDVEYVRYSVPAAAVEGLHDMADYSTLILRSIRGMVRGLISPRTLGGPVAIGKMAGQSLQLGIAEFVFFMAIISVNLAVLNLLPIPVLDGGQFLFLLAEAVIRRPLSLKLRERLTMVGLVAILLLMVFVFSNDILKLFGI
ncbi:MAG TPA: RIP metalloprotease RseP [Gemmatimonadales bacterium]|nr:RIP metalloprotease RseP [Gemmatimonadales bacterium]